MRADIAELVVEPVQILGQQPHHLHAEIAVLAEKLQEFLARKEGDRGLVVRFSSSPISFSTHALAQPEHSSRTDHLQELLFVRTGWQQDTNLARLDQVDSRDHSALLEECGAFREGSNCLDAMKRLQKIGMQFDRRGL